ncbi:hypothetical protein [Scytonema sp. NUACC21]
MKNLLSDVKQVLTAKQKLRSQKPEARGATAFLLLPELKQVAWQKVIPFVSIFSVLKVTSLYLLVKASDRIQRWNQGGQVKGNGLHNCSLYPVPISWQWIFSYTMYGFRLCVKWLGGQNIAMKILLLKRANCIVAPPLAESRNLETKMLRYQNPLFIS